MENKASEALRITKIFKENIATVITIGGFMWLLFSNVVKPIQQLEYSVGDIIGNHLKTIQDEQVVATAERKAQTDKLDKLSGELIRLTTILEQTGDLKQLK